MGWWIGFGGDGEDVFWIVAKHAPEGEEAKEISTKKRMECG